MTVTAPSCPPPSSPARPPHDRYASRRGRNHWTARDRGRLAGIDRSPARGEAHHWAKLDEEKVRYIRASEDTAAELAAQLGVCVATVRAVRARRAWGHVQ